MQSGFAASRDSPHIHLPPSPKEPILSSSCGQLKAGGKKSPVIMKVVSVKMERGPFTTYMQCKQAMVLCQGETWQINGLQYRGPMYVR
jgi:hypothetical protein